MATAKPPSYWEYLRLPELLSLQGGLEGDEEAISPDEIHFIVVHQVYELWFKLVLREIRLVRDELAADHVPEQSIPFVVHHLSRVNAIFKLCEEQFGVMETLIPQDFLEFRDKLMPSSGFQSFQMREVEVLLGLTEEERVRAGCGSPLTVFEQFKDSSEAAAHAWERIQSVQQESTLREALTSWLARTPINGSKPGDPNDDSVVDTFLDEQLKRSLESARAGTDRLVELGVMTADEAEERNRAAQAQARAFLHAEDVGSDARHCEKRVRAALLFIESYRELPLLAWPRLLLDTIVEFEEQLVLFRTRHARMVERVIGRRTGTGGSPGVDYLERTTAYRVFPELWNVRTLLLSKRDVPDLENRSSYEFAQD